MRSIVFAALLIAAHVCGAQVYECRDGAVRQFSDRPCGDVVKAWNFTEAPAAQPQSAERAPAERKRESKNHSRTRQAPRARVESYRCSAGARVWYQHDRCSGARGEAVRSERIARSEACREINRPAASLRRGSERDGRASPYDKAMGRDPC